MNVWDVLTGSQYSAGYQQYYQQQTGYQATQQQAGNQAAGGYQSNVPGATPSGGQIQQQPSQTGQAGQQSANQYPASYYQGKIVNDKEADLSGHAIIIQNT